MIYDNLYKVIIRWSHEGERIGTTLWYRSRFEELSPVIDLFWDASRALAQSVDEHVVDTWRTKQPAKIHYEAIEVYPFNRVFELLYNLPFVRPCTKAGAIPGGNTWAPTGNCITFRFNLAPSSITTPWQKPPRRGYISWSPVDTNKVTGGDTVGASYREELAPCAQVLAQTLPYTIGDIDIPLVGWELGVGIPGAFKPVRAKVYELETPQILGGDTFARWIAYSDVTGCVVSPRLGFRRRWQNNQ